MDVTEEILRNVEIYGASDYTAPDQLSASKALNYANGASIQKPINEYVTVIPRRLSYQDSVGLFGTENVFVKVNVDVTDTGNQCLEPRGWDCLRISTGDSVVNTFYPAVSDIALDTETVNTYEPALLASGLASISNPYISVNLTNLKTGNQYVDSWVDIRLYNKAREEHPYDEMYLPVNDYFYIGFHARNTKRLPYNVECLIGSEYITKDEVDPKLLAKVS